MAFDCIFTKHEKSEIDTEKLPEYLNNSYVLFYERPCNYQTEIEKSICIDKELVFEIMTS